MVQETKKRYRMQILKQRDALTEEEHKERSDEILAKLFSRPRLKEAKSVWFYIHKGSEVRTDRMIKKALKLGKEVLVPVTNGKIAFYKFTSFKELTNGKYDIPEPKERIEPENPPDVIVIPGICFGLCMHRVGYGKGYYDRYLGRSFAYRIGVCYDFQVMESLPRHPNDQRMDEIITEKRIIR